MATYYNLIVYKNSYKLALIVRKMSLKLPHEMADVAKQIRRSSKSIPDNIAEGYARNKSTKDKINFLRTSLGSNDETIGHLNFIRDCNSYKIEIITRLIEAYEVNGKRLNRLIQYNHYQKQDNKKTR